MHYKLRSSLLSGRNVRWPRRMRQLRCIRPYLHSSIACIIATSIVHSKLDYCNFLYYKLPKLRLSYPVSSRYRTLLLIPHME